MSKGLKLVIFDCDGVLVDSEVLACQVQSEALRGYGLELSPQEVARYFVGVAASEMRNQLEELLGQSLPHDHEERCATVLQQRFSDGLMPVPGIERVVDAVIAAGVAPCVASGSSLQRISLSLTLTGLADRFGASVFSASMVARGKPAPDLFLHAAAQMRLDPSDCLVIEDSAPGIRAAGAAGMRVIGFTAASHCGIDYPQQLLAAGADQIARDADDLKQRILRCRASHS